MNLKSWRLLPVVAILLIASTRASAQTSRETIENVLPKVVKIYGAGGIANLKAYSTGFLISPNGHVATIWSHVLDSDEVTIVTNDGRRYEAEVLGAEPQLNLAALKIREEVQGLPYFDLKEAATAGAGTRILGFSNMFKVAAGNEPVSVLHGVIASKTKLTTRRGVFESPYDGSVYVVDAITNNPGGAGGVITSRDGKLLGMIGKELRNSQSNTWINYAIPMTELQEVLKQIVSGNYTAREKKPEPGENPNRYRPLDFGIVMIPDVLFRTPAYVHSVLPGSPAEKAGVRPEDLVAVRQR